MTNFHLRLRIKESCILETPSLLTDADRSTNREKKYKQFCNNKKKYKNWQRVPPTGGEIPCKCGSIALWKVLAYPETLGVYNIFLPN